MLNLVLVDPVVSSLLVGDELGLVEPEVDLLLGGLNGVGTVADVAADIDGVVATDGTGGRGQGVGGTEDVFRSVSITFPLWAADGTYCDQS